MNNKIRTYLTASVYFSAVLALGLVIDRGPLANAQEPAMQVQAESKTCFECHEDEVKSYEHGLHRRAWSNVKGLENKSCTTCHGGDSGEHIRTKGKTTLTSFTKKAGQDPATLSKTCLQCHGSTAHVAMWPTSAHARNGVTCASCHNMHKGPLAVRPTSETCMECHKDQKKQVGLFSHHPVKEGKVSCNDCHNPHGTATKGMLVGDSPNQTCYKCHADKRGPYLWEHAPVEENCMNCHAPHGARYASLLTERQPYLCQKCHEAMNHPATMYSGATANGGSRLATPDARNLGRGCTNCHGKIHGSFAPQNPASTNSQKYNGGKYLLH